ncbi:hypothetical protein EVAR_36568_1 [Eumeta japonica]|uniref:Uncharacterized protein n=1 Tax=Eumeta variegata TaxID=151549 RepID=A0A4C1XYW1_EUMVA|nr:hypothetical protein EVAR_36568_1 [Eumeta japonica]
MPALAIPCEKVTTELERIKVGNLQDQNVKYEYVKRLKDSSDEIKQYECLEIDELWNVMKFVLVEQKRQESGSRKGAASAFPHSQELQLRDDERLSPPDREQLGK